MSNGVFFCEVLIWGGGGGWEMQLRRTKKFFYKTRLDRGALSCLTLESRFGSVKLFLVFFFLFCFLFFSFRSKK